MAKKLTYEYVKTYIESFDYTLLSDEYKNSRTKLLVKCPIGHIYEVRFNDFKSGYRCPHCANNVKYTYDYVKNYIEGYGYTLISTEYINAHTDLYTICPNGHYYKFKFCNFLKGYRCNICYGNNKKSFSYIKSFIENNGDILLSEQYKNAHTPLTIQCGKCNKINEITWNSYQQRNSCCSCGRGVNWNTKLVKEYADIYGYTILDNEYINSKQKMNMVCQNGHKILIRWSHFVQGTRCSKCSMSSGEAELLRILNNYGLEYIAQYKFDECKCLYRLPFDFYLPQQNICIEFDGEQHYKYGCFGHDLLYLMNVKYRDDIKTNYCKNNNIKLIRIPYWDFNNIEKIICQELELIK